jgi:hypothetical protein
MRIILAVQLLGRIRTRRLVPNTRLSGITHTGQTTLIEACGTRQPQAKKLRGTPQC